MMLVCLIFFKKYIEYTDSVFIARGFSLKILDSE